LPHQTIKIGRDDNPEKNTIAFDSPDVSRNHMEFYSVVVDEEAQHCSLVFARDRQSSNGTYVNGQLIGKGPDISPGWLLQNGDIVSITPDLTFKFSQLFEDGPSFGLSAHQQEELAVTLDKFKLLPFFSDPVPTVDQGSIHRQQSSNWRWRSRRRIPGFRCQNEAAGRLQGIFSRQICSSPAGTASYPSRGDIDELSGACERSRDQIFRDGSLTG